MLRSLRCHDQHSLTGCQQTNLSTGNFFLFFFYTEKRPSAAVSPEAGRQARAWPYTGAAEYERIQYVC